MIGITYKDSGVDIEASDRAVDLIKKKVEATFRHYSGEVLTHIGGFSGLVELPDKRVMGLATDGVGTKLILANILDQHNTVGQDLVAMCVNDLVVAGLTPSLFLDYMAMGKQIPKRTEVVISGIIQACEQAKCALIGGEMAEMPGMYDEHEYDLAGFAVGFADSKNDLILGGKVRPGMGVYGFPSSGVHSNGYSLIRKIFNIELTELKKTRAILDKYYKELDRTLGEELIEPTIIYVEHVRRILAEYEIAGMAHITGGGLLDNPIRILSEGCSILLDRTTWKMPPIFRLIKKRGNLTDQEMFKTFNCGIGLLVVSSDDIGGAILIGEVVSGEREVIML